MFKELIQLPKHNLNHFFALLIISFFPFFLLFSSLLTNLFVVILALLFLTQFKYVKKDILEYKVLFLLILFWFFILISLLTSINFDHSIGRSLGFLRFIIFAYAIAYYVKLENFRYFKIITLIWLTIFFLTSIDLLIEYIFGSDLLGNVSYMPGRLAGFLGKELKIGNYYLAFYFLAIATLLNIFKEKKIINIFLIVFFTMIAFAIGERANFIRIFLGFLIFFSLYEKILTKYKIIIFGFLFSFVVLFVNLNENYKVRYIDQVIKPIELGGINYYLKKHPYGAHFSTAFNIFKEYPVKGIGLKNFYYECWKDKYIDKKYAFNGHARCSTHPHQLHLEILSHVGIFGYLVFLCLFTYLIFSGIRTYLKTKNIFLLAPLIFIFVSIFTPLPTGSFFTTYGATMFWLNFGLVLAFDPDKYKT
tara:strand:+ start:278 stop:1534 length:1257 start_codon:yes stop_codon:yes gene_type:complete